MSEARTPEDDTIQTGDHDEPDDDNASDADDGGPDPEVEQKGDAADEDQGT